MRGRNSCESALEAEAVIHRVDPVNRELAALVEGVLVTIDVPPACDVILRGERVINPTPDEPLEAGDELLFVAHADVEEQLQHVLAPAGAAGLI